MKQNTRLHEHNFVHPFVFVVARNVLLVKHSCLKEIDLCSELQIRPAGYIRKGELDILLCFQSAAASLNVCPRKTP